MGQSERKRDQMGDAVGATRNETVGEAPSRGKNEFASLQFSLPGRSIGRSKMLEAGFAILAALALILLNGVWVVAEFAIVRVRRTRLEELAGQGVEAAKQAIVVVDGISDYLALTQIGITAASLAVGWIAESATERVIRFFFFPAHDQAGGTLSCRGDREYVLPGHGAAHPHWRTGPQAPRRKKRRAIPAASARPLRVAHLAARPLLRFSSECRPGLSTAWGTASPTIRRSRKMNSS